MTELMVMPNIARRQPGKIVSLTWQHFVSPPRHEFLAIACPDEEEGGFSVFAANIPGVVSQGETVEEATANISEAFIGMLEACRKRGQPLPYSDRPVIGMTSDCQKLWITVDG